MIKIREEEQPRLYEICKLLYGIYVSVYEVRASDQKTHWNICHFIVALIIAPFFWALKQIVYVILLSLFSCLLLYDAIQESKGSLKMFAINFVENIMDSIIVDDLSNDPSGPSWTTLYLWAVTNIVVLGYLSYQYPKLMLASAAIIIGAVLLTGIDNALGVSGKIQRTTDSCYARISEKISGIYHKACPCVKVIPTPKE